MFYSISIHYVRLTPEMLIDDGDHCGLPYLFFFWMIVLLNKR